MAQIQDQFIPITINVSPQGIANIVSITPTPSPALQGETVNVVNSLTNMGSSDTMWVKNYVNNVQQGTTWTGSVNGGGTVFTVNWSFTMPNANVIVRVEAGHMTGAIQTMDDSLEATVTLLVLAEGAFYGTVTYTPGQQVEPNTPVTVNYQVQNTGGTGMLWGGLYDYATPPNLLSGYWEQSVAPGSPVSKSATVTVTVNLDAQLLVGHFE